MTHAPHAIPTKPTDSMVAYYQDLEFNPVLIQVEDPAVWQQHIAKRRNLYERHLGVPLAYLRGARVVEFGPNSGENALLPALFGAKLTLVEPNQQVLPRLHKLFSRFGVAGQIESLSCVGIDDFTSEQPFDLVVAEGFLFTLPNRDALLSRLATLVRPGCLGVISYNDRCGGLLEYLRRAILFRACELAGIAEVQSSGCLELARRLFAEDCARINMSRSLDVWWRDTLVNPFCRYQHTWSLPDILPVLNEKGCEFFSSSPLWLNTHLYDWYKNGYFVESHRRAVLDGWHQSFAYFLTGLRPGEYSQQSADDETVRAVEDLVRTLADWEVKVGRTQVDVAYPAALQRYLTATGDPRLQQANEEWQKLFDALRSTDLESLCQAYTASTLTRKLWGTAYHYLCFQRSLDAAMLTNVDDTRRCA